MPRFAFAFLAVLLMTQPAAAVVREWSGAVDNKWATAGNWSPAGVPATGDTLIFPFEATVRNTDNDLPSTVILASASLVGAYRVTGNTVRISSNTNGGGQVTFTAPIQAEGDLTLSAESIVQLNPNGHVVSVQGGIIDQLIGNGELHTGYSNIALSGPHPFSGTIRDGLKVGSANFIQIDNLSMPNATFLIGAGLYGSGQIGPLIASGWVQPSTTSNTVGEIATGDLHLTLYSGLPEETGEYEVDLTAAGNDVLQVTGSVTLENKPLNVNLGFSPANGTTFVIVDNDGTDAVNGIFVMRANPTANFGTPLPEGATFATGGQHFQISYAGGTGNDVVLTAVPDTAPTSISATASASGNSVTVQASVTPSGATGTVTVKEGPSVLGTVALSSGSATLQFARFSGAHTFTVEYSGDGTFAPSSTLAGVTVGDPMLSIGDAVANEDGSQVEVTVTLTGPATENTVSVHYQTSNGTAIAGEDYAAASGTLLFFPGQTSRTVLVPLYADEHPEDDEWLEITLTNPSNATVADGIGRVTIANDDSNFTLLGDIEYAPMLFLDLRIPTEGAGPFPLVVVIDAANWLQAIQHTTIADFLPANGYAVATLGFRSAAGALFPAQLDDVRHAITFLRANASRFQLDTLRMGMLGNGRAGGHLAALAAVTDGSSQHFDAVVVAEAAADLPLIEQNHCAGENDVAKLLGCVPSHCMTTALDASPVTHVSGGDPPFFLLNTGDACDQDAALLDALRAAHVGGTVLYVTNFEVPAPGWDAFVVQANILNFLEARLKEERTGRRRAIRK
jgi:acetyl esterase/lipase